MSLTFEEISHTYRWDGKIVPSVTQILKPLTDYGSIPDGVLEKARQEGTAIHSMVEYDEEGQLDRAGLPEWMRPYLDAWHLFKSDSGWATDASEKKLYHKVYKFAGTCDLTGTAPKLSSVTGRGLIDIKRSFYAGAAIGLQLSAYAEAESIKHTDSNMRIRWRAALQLKKDGRYKLEIFDDKADWNTFLSCLVLHKWLEKHRS